MLSYQHIYHAGCLADLHKHIALTELLANMIAEHQDLLYIETHSGRGVYNLLDKEARKTKESNFGIKKFLVQHTNQQVIKRYLHAINITMMNYGKSYYPGSPQIANILLRPTDTIHCIELHPKEYQHLASFANHSNINHHYGDGYLLAPELADSLGSKVVIFIDPSYEIKSEYVDCAKFILNFCCKFPAATVLCWVPVLPTKLCYKLLGLLKDGLSSVCIWQQEVSIATLHKIQGSILIGVNIPVVLQKGLADIPTILHAIQE